MAKKCNKFHCSFEIQSPKDDFCLFHSKQKAVSDEEFERILIEHSKRSNYYSEFIIPCDLELNRIIYKEGLLFDGVQMFGKLRILNCKVQGQLKFNDAIFHDKLQINNLNRTISEDIEDTIKNDINFQCDARFNNVEFRQTVSFSGSFIGGMLNLDNVKAHKKMGFTSLEILGYVFLSDAVFEEELQFMSNKLHQVGYCLRSKFNKTLTFRGNEFNNFFIIDKSYIENDLNLDNSKVLKLGVNICNSYINGDLSIKNIDLNGSLNIKDISFGNYGSLHLENPKFIEVKGEKLKGGLSFQNIIFNPYKTFFSQIQLEDHNENSIVSFRHCDLSNVYFEQCNFADISLFTSKFSNANFIDCKWFNSNYKGIDRNKMIFEDRLFYLKSLKKTEKNVGPMLNYQEISYLYNQFKNAFDSAKKYNFSGDFYFNELDTKREYYRSTNRPLYLLYTLYKYLTWYGQRPHYCGFALIALIGAFTTYNLFNGLKVIYQGKTRIVNYDIDLSKFSIFFKTQFWNDLGNSLIYGLNRIVPFNYTKFSEQLFFAENPTFLNYIVNILYTLIALIYLYSLVIGLRRHFKRF